MGNTLATDTIVTIGNGSPPYAWGIPCRISGFPSITTVHPHMHGEYCLCPECHQPMAGSPPYAWGILQSFPPLGSVLVVHPHMHGEYVTSYRVRAYAKGSPPYAWGIHYL